MEFFTGRIETVRTFLETQLFPTEALLNLFRWEYWTESGLASSSPFTLSTILAIALLLLGLIIARVKFQRQQQTTPIYTFEIQQLASIISFILLITPSYWFFRAQQIDYLSSRLVILLSLLIVLIWIVVVVIHWRRVTPKMRTSYLEQQRFFRYLPKKRKREE